MSGLVLKLKPQERFMINGVVLQNGDKRSKVVVVTPDVNVLRLKDAIHPDEVNTPVTRVCYIAQLILAGEADEAEAKHQLLRGIDQLAQVFTDPESRMHLAQAAEETRMNRFYQVMKSLRSLMPREQHLLALAS